MRRKRRPRWWTKMRTRSDLSVAFLWRCCWILYTVRLSKTRFHSKTRQDRDGEVTISADFFGKIAYSSLLSSSPRPLLPMPRFVPTPKKLSASPRA